MTTFVVRNRTSHQIDLVDPQNYTHVIQATGNTTVTRDGTKQIENFRFNAKVSRRYNLKNVDCNTDTCGLPRNETVTMAFVIALGQSQEYYDNKKRDLQEAIKVLQTVVDDMSSAKVGIIDPELATLEVQP